MAASFAYRDEAFPLRDDTFPSPDEAFPLRDDTFPSPDKTFSSPDAMFSWRRATGRGRAGIWAQRSCAALAWASPSRDGVWSAQPARGVAAGLNESRPQTSQAQRYCS